MTADLEWASRLLKPAYGYVKDASKGAGELVRSGYEDMFKARAGAAVGGFDEQQSRLMANAAQSGLSPDVLQRMLYAPGMQVQNQIGQARAETQGGMNFDLAQLMKGTGSELAGLSEEEANMKMNLYAQKRGEKMAGWGMAGGLLGTAAGAALGGGGMSGGGMGGMGGGGGGGGRYG
jgi:hypothetical protein